ncbi:MAG: hypothetical protein HY366_01205 [Candidatus Aenigmarchaeota archaeon]|nr:hypothetical protein [Candidatus Aenigmarchaeota archaeon]
MSSGRLRLSKKGQSLTVEQMFLFTMGVLITIGIFLSFRSISGHVTSLAEEDQLNEVGSLVVTGIQRIGKELVYSDSATLVMEIPKQISRREYTIVADGASVIVTLPGGKNATMGLEGSQNAYLVTGRATSSSGSLRIEGRQDDKSIRLVRTI